METMKKSEKGHDKVSQICHVLRKEAIEPAEREAAEIIAKAKADAEEIIKEAAIQAERYISEARLKIEQERNVFQSALSQASKQALESLRQNIQYKLFNDELRNVIDKYTADPKLVAQLINAICMAIEKEGIGANIQAFIPKHVSSAAVNALLVDSVIKKLQDCG
jgi:V/A-type H+-transporting ATPase subunit E